MQSKNALILKWTLIAGIVIVLNLFFNFAISSVYHAPKFDDFCKPEKINVQPASKEACLTVGGQWNESVNVKSEVTKPVVTPRSLESTAYCDASFTCRKNFESAREVYDRNVFIVLVVLGIASVAAGFVTASIYTVSTGLSLGGILSLVIASIRYWSAMSEYLRVIILGLALVALIWIGIKRFRD